MATVLKIVSPSRLTVARVVFVGSLASAETGFSITMIILVGAAILVWSVRRHEILRKMYGSAYALASSAPQEPQLINPRPH
jgi:hypothetical protein